MLSAVLLLLAGLAAFLAYRASRNRNAKLPPGPKGSFILGVTSEMLDTSVKPWIRFQNWSKEYNAPALLHVPTLGNTNIVINDVAVATELMERRHKFHSGRPREVFDAEYVEGSMVLANISDPEEVQKRRKLLNESLGVQGAKQCQPAQMDEARRLVNTLLKSPTKYLDCIAHSMQVLVLRNVYHTTKSMSFEALWKHSNHRMMLRPKPSLVRFLQIFPTLRFLPEWVPGANFKTLGNEYHNDDTKVWFGLMKDVKDDLVSEKAHSSIMSRWIDSDAGSRFDLTEKELAWAASNLLTAGGDLPDVTLQTFQFAMIYFPAIFKQVQAEIDSVVGRSRLPTFEDKEKLPFTRATILEVQRWRTISPMGTAHVTTEDDVYEGMLIPKGTKLYPSLWAMSRDERYYPNPEEFLPQRHLKPDGSFTRKKELPTWGFGKRQCSAMHLAEATLFMYITTLAWAFDFEVDGELPSADTSEWEGTLPVGPPAFKSRMTPRGPEVERLITEAMLNSEYEAAEPEFSNEE